MDCPFCHEKRVLSVFNASENFLAIYNIAPIFPGHSLIIPKKHYERFKDLPQSMQAELMPFAQKVSVQIQQVFKVDGFDIAIQDGQSAGQTIEHFHMHIIPRYENDLPNPGDWYPEFEKNEKKIVDSQIRPRLSEEEIFSVVRKLKNN